MDWIDITYIAFAILLFCFAFGAGYFLGRIKERNEPKQIDEVAKLKLPPCRCRDVNQCDLWCDAKERFKRYHP